MQWCLDICSLCLFFAYNLDIPRFLVPRDQLLKVHHLVCPSWIFPSTCLHLIHVIAKLARWNPQIALLSPECHCVQPISSMKGHYLSHFENVTVDMKRNIILIMNDGYSNSVFLWSRGGCKYRILYGCRM